MCNYVQSGKENKELEVPRLHMSTFWLLSWEEFASRYSCHFLSWYGLERSYFDLHQELDARLGEVCRMVLCLAWSSSQVPVKLCGAAGSRTPGKCKTRACFPQVPELQSQF